MGSIKWWQIQIRTCQTCVTLTNHPNLHQMVCRHIPAVLRWIQHNLSRICPDLLIWEIREMLRWIKRWIWDNTRTIKIKWALQCINNQVTAKHKTNLKKEIKVVETEEYLGSPNNHLVFALVPTTLPWSRQLRPQVPTKQTSPTSKWRWMGY